MEEEDEEEERSLPEKRRLSPLAGRQRGGRRRGSLPSGVSFSLSGRPVLLLLSTSAAGCAAGPSAELSFPQGFKYKSALRVAAACSD